VRIAAYSRPFPGELHNGDAYFIARFDHDKNLVQRVMSDPQATGLGLAREMVDLGKDDFALIAVVDGLGHGEGAAAVSAQILACLNNSASFDLISLVTDCHRVSLNTREQRWEYRWSILIIHWFNFSASVM